MNRLLSLAVLVTLFSCDTRDKHGQLLDSPTSGTISITVDESLKPLIDAEIEAFEAIYRNAKIEASYMSEGQAIEKLLMDSARLAIVTRSLVESERQRLDVQAIVPTELKMATGGVALITNRRLTDSLIDLDVFRMLLSGTTKPGSVSEIVFDDPGSGIVRYLSDTLNIPDRLPEHCFALKGSAAVVEYVSKNPKALGLIDVCWISDGDDSTANTFLNSINVLGVSADSGYYKPYQAYLAQHKYPLARDLLMISREARAGLASGFMAFVASDKGQRIVLKSGLVPATMPIRIIEVNHEPF
jgi:phosphate transport system substrate-binding protein